MKAALDSKGTLTITSEYEIESYALVKWFRGYMAGENEVLSVEGVRVNPPLPSDVSQETRE